MTSADLDRAEPSFSARMEGDAVLLCSGELDAATNPLLGRLLRRVQRLTPDRVVVDLSRVTFFDAGAIGEFVRARTNNRSSGGELVVRRPSPFGRRLLDICGLAELVADDQPRPTGPSYTAVDVDAHAAELASAWEAACTAPCYGASPLAFDPMEMMAAVSALFDRSPPGDPTVTVPSLAVTRREETSAATAVMQLWALSDVFHEWTGTGSLDAALAGLAASVIAELERAALLDPLTGLLNRRALRRDLPQSLATARRHRQCLSVVMIDVDGLKATNDRFGHAAGDAILRGVATTLTGALRAGDNAYRFGGDEFVLVLPELCPDDVDGVMKRTATGERGSFTWGCASLERDDVDARPDGERSADLLQQADRRMLEHRARVRGSRAHVDAPRATSAADVDASAQLARRFSVATRAQAVVAEATGLLAERFGLTIDEALHMLRVFSDLEGQPIVTIAAALVTRHVDVDQPSAPRSGQVRALVDHPGQGAEAVSHAKEY